ncbi:MAG: nitrite reductase large subunit, partial [Rugosibacter sp.]
YVAGNGGIKTEVAEFLCKVTTREEVLEYSAAFLQLYREEGWYLERTVHYVQRVGLDYVKQRVVADADNRKALHQRLLYALQGVIDPWRERLPGDGLPQLAAEFTPLPVPVETI